MQPTDLSALKTVSCHGWAVMPPHMGLTKGTLAKDMALDNLPVDSLHLQVCQDLKAPAADRGRWLGLLYVHLDF